MVEAWKCVLEPILHTCYLSKSTLHIQYQFCFSEDYLHISEKLQCAESPKVLTLQRNLPQQIISVGFGTGAQLYVYNGQYILPDTDSKRSLFAGV